VATKATKVLYNRIGVGIYPQLKGFLSKIYSVVLYTLSLSLIVIVPLNPLILFISDVIKLGIEEVLEYLPLCY
jgi:hypothetical protein